MKRDLSERLRKFARTGGFSTQITTRILRLVDVLRRYLEQKALQISLSVVDLLLGITTLKHKQHLPKPILSV